MTIAVLFIFLIGCAQEHAMTNSAASVASALNDSGAAADIQVVDCLLPGQIRQLGTMTTYVTERRPTRTTKEDCAIRGGEYVAVDRADYQTALKIWLADAEKGSAEAQYYAATIYEKGQGGTPDYQQAAGWYRKAAEQGDKRAAIALGRLYQQGLGVKKDPGQAFKWFAKASELNPIAMSQLANTQPLDLQAQKRIQELETALATKEQDIQKLSDELQRVNHEVETLRQQLDERTAQMEQGRATLQQQEQQSQALQAELASMKSRPDTAKQASALEQQLRAVQLAMTQEKRQLSARNAEIAQLQSRIAILVNNAARIQVLEQTIVRKDIEVVGVLTQLATANQELTRLSNQLNDRQRLAADEQRKSQEAEARYVQARRELEQLRNKPDQTDAIVQYEETVKKLQSKMIEAKQELDKRNQDVAALQEKIDSLETEAEEQTKALQAAAVTDLGFDGPSLEIIDPPLARTRGIQIAKDELAIPISTNARRSVTGRVLAPAGLRTLTINGEPAKPNDEGVFTATLPPLRSNDEEIAIQILAVDLQNKRASLKFMLKARGTATIAPILPQTNLTDFGRYHALVIGNDHYRHWPQLMNAISDATDIANALKEHYGFEVTLLKDATRGQIMKALNQYRKILTEKDNLLIYYAGHGHLEQGIDRGYWIPVDAETNDNSEWVLLPSVTDMLQLISAKHVMVVADSCFGGKLTRNSLAQLKPGLSDAARFDLLKTLAQKRVRTAMTSGGVKPVLDTGGSGHSVFAEAFLGVLKDNATVLEAERLFWAVRTRVVSTSQKLHSEQIPTYDPIHMAGHESLGDFIFVPRIQ